MSKILGELEASIEQTLASDTEFQTSIAELAEEEQKAKKDERKAELLDIELDKLKKNEELANNYKVRAEKAEKIAKEKETPVVSADGLSSKDVLYLAKADIHQEDVDDVLIYAKKMGVSIADAHKFFKPILAERDEERKSANATNTKSRSRGADKHTPEDTLAKAEKGEVLETEDELKDVFKARINRKFARPNKK